MLSNCKCLFVVDLKFTFHSYSSSFIYVILPAYQKYGPSYQVINAPYGVADNSVLMFFLFVESGSVGNATVGLSSDEGFVAADNGSIQCSDYFTGVQYTVTVTNDTNSADDSMASLSVFKHSNLIFVDSRNDSGVVFCQTSLGTCDTLNNVYCFVYNSMDLSTANFIFSDLFLKCQGHSCITATDAPRCSLTQSPTECESLGCCFNPYTKLCSVSALTQAKGKVAYRSHF